MKLVLAEKPSVAQSSSPLLAVVANRGLLAYFRFSNSVFKNNPMLSIIIASKTCAYN